MSILQATNKRTPRGIFLPRSFMGSGGVTAPNAYWPLSEASGSRTDLIGSLVLVEIGTVGKVTDPDIGEAAHTGTGSNSLRMLWEDAAGLLLVPAAGAVSWSIWTKPIGNPAVIAGLVNTWDGSSGDRIIVPYHTTDVLSIYAHKGSGGFYGVSIDPFTLASSYHIVVSLVSTGDMTVYSNGSLVGSIAITEDFSGKTPNLQVGRLSDSDQYYYDGYVSKLSWWTDYELTPDEASWLWNSGTPRTDVEMTSL